MPLPSNITQSMLPGCGRDEDADKRCDNCGRLPQRWLDRREDLFLCEVCVFSWDTDPEEVEVVA
jgi:hypothetical protein